MLLVLPISSTHGEQAVAPFPRQVFDPPEMTSRNCQSNSDCGPGFACERTEYNPTNRETVMRCAYLPVFVFPRGTKPVPFMLNGVETPAPASFRSGGDLPPAFPREWRLKKGPLPAAPDGYMWVYAPDRLCGFIYCGSFRPCPLDESPHPPDWRETYVLMPQGWSCLRYFSSSWWMQGRTSGP